MSQFLPINTNLSMKMMHIRNVVSTFYFYFGNFENWIKKISFIFYVAVFLVISYLPLIVWVSVYFITGHGDIHSQDYVYSNQILAESVDRVIIENLIIAPLLETFLFQKILFKFFSFFVNSRGVKAFLLAFLFAVFHLYNYEYFIKMFIFGGGLAYCYIFQVEKGKQGSPFFATAMVHALKNVIALFVIYF